MLPTIFGNNINNLIVINIKQWILMIILRYFLGFS